MGCLGATNNLWTNMTVHYTLQRDISPVRIFRRGPDQSYQDIW